ncbi:MAG TPA: hypothetical protein VMV83_06060 [Rectinemataceae bacterium]|nr:hypothetical protein [Rectinemataceae bacterium]
MANTSSLPRAWVAAANMGLGHMRAVDPLADIAEDGIMIANDPDFADPQELKTWEKLLGVYERLSRAKSIPLIGNFLFGVMDYFQQIPRPYPRIDLSNPSIQTMFVDRLVGQGLCSAMLTKMKTKPLPLITSFYQNAIAADRAGWGRVYCIICDADINRAWVASNPRESRIQYLVPCGAAMRRLKQYGVPDERIFMTGFPLPRELLGDASLDVLKRDLAIRLRLLDPTDRFWPLHGLNVEHFLGAENCARKPDRPLTITYAVGGAGAQKEIGVAAFRSLKGRIEAGAIAWNFVCGVRKEVRAFFEEEVAKTLPGHPGVRIVGGKGDSTSYFADFAAALHTTDILWTKPSELSFYAGLGLPLLMAPSVGSQEVFNRRWLEEIQAGIPQAEAHFADTWLVELLEQGRFAEAAWSGFLKARKYSTFRIHELIKTGAMTRSSDPLTR